MAKEVKTVETKKITVTVSKPWGTYKKNYSTAKRENTLTIKFTYDVIKKKFGTFLFKTTKRGTWFGIDSLENLRALHMAISEAEAEANKLLNA